MRTPSTGRISVGAVAGELLNDQDASPIAGVAATVHGQDRELARQIYRARLMALKAAGWRRT
jgi:hypothetical protein